ncbi:MAG TPA: type II secretion system major pseudopilin GspG [Candidatus Saccharimonadia bacterium]|nr:type II secretion system major pseudopilin GspG [Candidatus Saccharimonadia bacterium]
MNFASKAPQIRSAGFTLMEMMLVLLIITLIIGGVAVMAPSFTNTAARTTTKTKLQTLEASLMSYRTDNSFYPSQQQGLEALLTFPSSEPRPKFWKQLVKPDGIIDGWGRKIVYRSPGKRNPSGYDLVSFGEDGVEGTNDDIGNW